ncbi:MAG: helix-turn-helix domain-containing protein [Opitutales bacterium]|nr:helix-turn-helix domain-containing protein [Opitutales bacterium]
MGGNKSRAKKATPPVQALGAYYFQKNSLPITVKRVRTDKSGKAAHPNDFTETPHFHDFSELAIVLEGQGKHHLEGDAFPISPGDVFLLQGSQVHWFSERKELTLLNVMYDPKQLPLPFDALRKIPGYSAVFLLEPHFRRSHKFSSRLHLDRTAIANVERITETMMEEEAKAKVGFEALLLSGLLELTTYVSRQYAQTERVEAQALLKVSKVIAAMEGDYARQWTVEDFTEISHLSRSHLFRLFKQATGESLIDYLIHIRLQRAQMLLRTTDQCITEIAYTCGFSDGNYFARQFRKSINLTPSEYRNQYTHRIA